MRAALGPLLIIEFMAPRVWLGFGPWTLIGKPVFACCTSGKPLWGSSLAFLVVTHSRYVDSQGLNLGYRRLPSSGTFYESLNLSCE